MPSNGLDEADTRLETPASSRADAARQAFFRAITHPLRAHLLDLLATDGPATAAQLASATARPRGSISYHLGVLERSGAVERSPAEADRTRSYRAVARNVIEDDEWARLPTSLLRSIVAGDLRHISRESHAAVERGGFDHPEAHISWTPVALDSVGVDQMAKLLRETVDRVLAIAAGVRQRSPDRDADEMRTELAILHFSREVSEGTTEPPHNALPRLYALTDEIGDVVPEHEPDWQRIADRAFELAALAQRYGAAQTDSLA